MYNQSSPSSSSNSSTDLPSNKMTSPVLADQQVNQNIWSSSSVNSYVPYNNYNYMNMYYPSIDNTNKVAYNNYNPSQTNYKSDDLAKNNEIESSKDEANESSNMSSNDQTNMLNSYPINISAQKIQNNTTKLSYTIAQLELLNSIYETMKYPNSVQKTMISKIIGITRDQVKIWFQNKRRKETLQSQGKAPITKSNGTKRRLSSDDFESNNEDNLSSSPEPSVGNKKQMVDSDVIQGVLHQLKMHQNAPSRLSSKRAKLTSNEIESKLNKQPSDANIIINVAPNKNGSAKKESLETKNSATSSLYQEQYVLTTSEPSSNLNFNSDNSVTTPSSFLMSSMSSLSSSTSSSSTSSSSSSSSSEEEVIPSSETKFEVLQQPFTIGDFVDNKYNILIQNSKKLIKYHPDQYSNNAYTAQEPQPCNKLPSYSNYPLIDSTKQYQNSTYYQPNYDTSIYNNKRYNNYEPENNNSTASYNYENYYQNYNTSAYYDYNSNQSSYNIYSNNTNNAYGYFNANN